MISGVRKISQDISFQTSYPLPPEVGFEDIGYTRAKYRQLERIYWNSEVVDQAIEKLLSRKGRPHTSVAWQLKNGEKDSRSQGQCMQNMVLTVANHGTDKEYSTIDVYYRSTEVTQKFLADLIFFAEVLPPVMEKAGLKPSVIRFKFANVYLSAVFAPIFLRYEPRPVAFFNHLKSTDPRFWRTYALATSKFFKTTHNYSYRTRVKMFDYAQEHISEQKLRSLRVLLKPLMENANENIPELHGSDQSHDGEDEE